MPQDSNFPRRILVIEDQPDLAELLSTALRSFGHEVEVELDGTRGLAAARREAFDLVILDKGLPGLDGFEVCRRLREASDVPVLMLTAESKLTSRIEGLNAGANDYLPKPFDMGELLARVNSQLRAYRPAPKTRVAAGDLELDLETREARRAGRPLVLTAKEFELLRFLAENPNRVVTREAIIERVWGHGFDGEASVLDVFISNLRRKVEQAELPRLIHTSRGVGYCLRPGGAR